MSQPPTIETSAASSYTGTLIFDLVVDILSRLPAKSLIQLKCVCKSWNSLISDPNFANKHLSWSRTHLNRHHLLLSGSDSDSGIRDTQLSSFFNSTSSTIISGTPLSFPLIDPDWNNTRLVGSCDGILCFSNAANNSYAMVWNPSIQKFKILPPLEYQGKLERTIYGFGYDCLTHTYKLVAICSYDRESVNSASKIQVKLHTLGKDTWKTVEGFPSRLQVVMVLSKHGIFVSGAVNWLVGLPYLPSSPQVILSLDLGNESFHEFLPPDCGKVYHFTLEVLRDCLCILAHTITSVIHVWLMKDYGNQDSWTKLFTFPLMELFGRHFEVYPLYISEDDQLLLDLEEEVAVYNSRDGTGKAHDVQSILGCNFGYFEKRVYIESLIAP